MALTAQDKQFLLTLKNQGVSKEEAINRLVEAKKGFLEKQSPMVASMQEQIGKALPGATAIQAIEEKVPFVGETITKAIPGAKEIQKEEEREEIRETLKEGASATFLGEAMSKTPVGEGLEKAGEAQREREEAISTMPDDTVFQKIQKADKQFKGLGKTALSAIGLPMFETGEAIGEAAMDVPFLPGGLAQSVDQIESEGIKVFASPNEILESYVERAPEPVKEIVSTQVRDKVDKFNSFYNSLDPVEQQELRDTGIVFQSLMGLIGGATLSGGAKGPVKAGLKKVDELVEAIPKKQPKVEPVKLPVTKKDVTPIQEMFTASGTKKVKDQAFREGRVVVGEKGVLTGEKADFVIPSAKEVNTAKVVEKYLGKDIAKKDVSFAHKAVGDQIEVIAKDLAPELKAIKADKNSVKSLKTKQKKLAKEQLDDPIAAQYEKSAEKAQAQFEKVINRLEDKAKKNELSLDDLWQARKDYDLGVKSRIKTAPDTAESQVLMQKDIWLENRSLLNDMLDEQAKKLGTDVKEAFSDMNALYNGQSILETNFKFQAKDKPGFIGKQLGGVIGTKGAIAGAGLSALVGYSLNR